MCGEQLLIRRLFQQKPGSPPRVRGTEACCNRSISASGITPACAGNSSPGAWARRWGWDHPRVCGEQINFRCSIRGILGSPPRVRGTVQLDIHKGGYLRITPACAGNRNWDSDLYGGAGDHPRVCGEQFYTHSIASFMAGSPPRVRGTGGDHPGLWPSGGITPACAGNSRGGEEIREKE